MKAQATRLTQVVGVVQTARLVGDRLIELTVEVDETIRTALAYPELIGPVEAGDRILLNTTANNLELGTGGFDLAIANLSHAEQRGASGLDPLDRTLGHIVKCRYAPCQTAVLTLEEQPELAQFWERELDGFPVAVGQLHSQAAPVAAGLAAAGAQRVIYIMTDQAALPLALSRSVREIKSAGLVAESITCGQAFGGDYETVTLHSALLAAKHLLHADSAIVCQGPGAAGTGTRYGFSGIEQAQNLDIVAALGGVPVAVARMSSADPRPRHQGISHHTRTALRLTRSRCLVPLPEGANSDGIESRHEIIFVPDANQALDQIRDSGVRLESMGRSDQRDALFFAAAAAAGIAAGDQGKERQRHEQR